MNELQEFLNNEVEIKVGDVAKVQVLAYQDNKQVIVSIIGTGLEGVIPAKELSKEANDNINDIVSIGDELDAVVISTIKDKENGGSYLLSKIRFDYKKIWQDLENKLTVGKVVTGTVKSKRRGGLLVEVEGVEAFVPASLIDTHYVKNLDKYVGSSLEFQVQQFDASNKKIILDRKSVLEDIENKKWDKVFSTLNMGDILTGKVSHFSNFGAFVSIEDGVEGLVHISEIAHNHIKNASDVLSLNETVTVKVIELDRDNKRIGLSIKQLVPTAWEIALSTFKKGDTVKGIVKRIVDFGAFVELSPSVDGLLHISEVAHERINNVSDVLNINDEIEVKIIDLDIDNKKIGLSRKVLIEKEEPVKKEEVVVEEEADNYDINAENVTVTLGDVLGKINLENE